RFSGGGARFSGAQVRGFSGARIGTSRGSVAHISGAHVRGSRISGAQVRGSRVSGAQVRGSHISGAQVRGSHISGARTLVSGAGTLGGRAAWNQWGNHQNHWRTGWNGGWGGWGGWGWGGWTYWPYFYGDLLAFTLWPYGYYDPFWAYGDIFVWDAMFWPGPDYAYGPGYFDVYGNYAYGGPARTRAARARNVDREITGSTTTPTSSDLAQTCGGLAPGVTDLPVDYIEEAIKPTDEQRKALVALKAASSQASDALKASCSSEVLLTPLGRLDTVQKRLDGMIQAVGIVRTPLDNFYNSLSEEQRQRFAALGPASDARTNRRGSASGNDLAALCSRRTENFTQLPVERIEQAVKPTQEQQDAFARLKIASTEAANQLQASCPTQTPQSPMDRFDALGKRLGAMAEAIKTVRPALASFYGSLTDEQKARFNTLGPPQTTAPAQNSRSRQKG
ncbi:MAG: Spy/CpxP family protein refolding chaperone, partial [Candidatus Angelobacter sp.]